MAPLPRGFVDLSTAYRSPPNSFLDIVGTVVDIQPATATKSQYMLTFKLLDEKLRDSIQGAQGLTVRFFKEAINALPQVRHLGDVVLVRNIKLTYFNSMPMALSNYQTMVVVFPVTSIPAPSYELAYQDKNRLTPLGVTMDIQKLTPITLEQQAYVIHLKQEMQSTVGRLPDTTVPFNAPSGPAATRKRSGDELQQAQAKKLRVTSFGQKFRTISEVRQQDFADLCIQVVKKFPSSFGYTELYVTDYTENKGAYHYVPPEAETENQREGDEYGYGGDRSKREWPGPYGYLVLKVEVKHPHADFANREVTEGDFVLLRNVRLKSANGLGTLEGNMWPDSINPDKVQIHKIRDKQLPEMDALLERKRRYWTAREAKIGGNEKPNEKEQRTKTEKRKLKKQAKAKAAEKKATKAAVAAITNSNTTDEDADVVVKERGIVNPHVRCGNQEVRLSSFSEIMDSANKRHTNDLPDDNAYTLPFVNARYRIQARVVDFEPKQLEDFAVLASTINKNDSDEDSVIMIDYECSPSYEWSFSLVLEPVNKSQDSPRDQIQVIVGHEEAQYLFGNDVPDPVDLRRDKKLLAKVREKLCILWGNLEEKGEEEAVSNLPFECCLMEYGVEVDRDVEDVPMAASRFERLYRMFGVTIS